MASDFGKKNRPAPETTTVVKRRGLLRFGTLITAFSGASAISALNTNSAHAAPGDKNPSLDYVPIAQKGVASGVATLDPEAKIPPTQLPDLSATYAPAVGSSTYATLNDGGMIGVPVQGLYARTRPGPDASGLSIRPLAKDPSVPNRLWAVGSAFSQIGYTDDNGATFVAKTAPPAGGAAGVQQMLFSTSYVWLLQGPNTAKAGSLWRSPLPDASGNGMVWTKVFDLAAPPSGITTGDNATFRNSCVAVNGTNVYLAEYSVATITGGASLYYSADSGASWSKPKTWANAKHCHAVKVIGGVPWVMNGDGGFTDLGLWTATAANALAWNQRSRYGPTMGGNYLYGINFFPITVDGQTMVVSEYDGNENFGPMWFPTQDPTKTKPFFAPFRLPPTHLGTMRQLTLTSEGNLMWVHTSENGAIGARDSIWISKAPFNSAALLESFPPITDTLGDPVENGDYVWFGTYRIRKEKFVDQ